MPPAKDQSLEDLLRSSAGADTASPASITGGDDTIARRVALYAELLRLAPPPAAESVGRLLLATPTGGVRTLALAATPVGIGRGSTCALHLEDPEVSRRHCRAGVDAGGAWIEDLCSANDTWLNDQRITARTRLRDGDILRVGRTLLVFACP